MPLKRQSTIKGSLIKSPLEAFFHEDVFVRHRKLPQMLILMGSVAILVSQDRCHPRAFFAKEGTQ